MLNTDSITIRLAEIELQLNYLSLYQAMAYEEFKRLPKNFGGATRFIQLIAKYAIEIASQIALELNLRWKEYRDLFAMLKENHILTKELYLNLVELSEFYLPATLMQKNIKDVYEMTKKINELIKNFSSQIITWSKK
jgi:uncharacterized protein YutE (UPF0331/DUF86 family)